MASAPLPPLAAVTFAERLDYPNLLRALAMTPSLARATDDFGMTPLHWICSDPAVPLPALQRVVLAHPPASAARNLAGLLPFHLAIRKNLPLAALETLLRFYSKAIVTPTPDGKMPLDLAKDARALPSTVAFLRRLEEEVCALTQRQQYRRRRQSDSVIGEGVVTSHLTKRPDPVAELLATAKLEVSAPQLPPEWKLARHCRVCDAKFSYLRGRHHCRNCGESVCGRHSRHSVPLRHLGLFLPQRVCAPCFDGIQSHYSARALARVAPLGERAALFNVPGIPTLSAEAAKFKRGTRSRSLYSESTGPHCSARLFSPRSVGTADVESIHLGATPPIDPVTPEDSPLSPRLLASSELMTRSMAWDEFELDDSLASNEQRSPSPPKLSAEEQVAALEEQMTRLLSARRQLSSALQRSQREMERAQRDRVELDAVASKYKEQGYPSDHDSEAGDLALDEEDENRLALAGQSTAEEGELEETESENRGASANEYEDSPLENARYCDDGLVNSSRGFKSPQPLTPRLMPTLSEVSEPDVMRHDAASTHYDLGTALVAKGDNGAAIRAFRQSLQLDPSQAAVWNHLAKALDAEGDREGAEQAVHRALSLQPNSLSGLSLLGRLLHLRGAHDEAIAVFRRALALQGPKMKPSSPAASPLPSPPRSPLPSPSPMVTLSPAA